MDVPLSSRRWQKTCGYHVLSWLSCSTDDSELIVPDMAKCKAVIAGKWTTDETGLGYGSRLGQRIHDLPEPELQAAFPCEILPVALVCRRRAILLVRV